MGGERLRTASAAITLLLLVALAAPAGAAAWQRLGDAGIAELKLFDLGVSDYDGDGRLDLFTANHKFSSSLLRGDGAGGLTESGAVAGLSPTPLFPGLEALDRSPDLTAPGLYVYASDRAEPGAVLRIRTTGAAASGRLTFAGRRLDVLRADGATATTATAPAGNRVLTFEADPGAAIDVTADHLDLPIEVAIDPPTVPGSIRVGADAVPAPARGFELTLRDRHALGFADFDGDGRRDVFIAAGGLGGQITDPFFTGKQTDELLLARPGGWADATAASGLVKGTCRGRGVVVADFDGDGNLDVLEACEGEAPLIHRGDGGGGFTTTAGPPALARTYRAVDLIGDRRPEIVAAGTGTVAVWRRRAGRWERAQRLHLPGRHRHVKHLALGDYDGDGDLDLFAAAPQGNTMLRNDGGRLRRRDGRRLGLPRRGSATAAFVDFDNDGDLDLDLVPQGLMRARAGGFTQTGRLAYGPHPTGPIRSATVSWPDLDGNGRRDPISARAHGDFAPSQLVDARLSEPPARPRRSHWLEADLVGPAGNREAIGARVAVVTAAGRQTAWVGQSEDSHGSSGHYRLYWGLGRAARVERLVVVWPDGSRSKRRGVATDRLLTIRR